MTDVASILHRIRDGLLVAASALERDDEIGAAEELERTITEAREGIDEMRAA